MRKADTMMEHEYLSRPLVEDVKYAICETEIHIHCPHTLFIHVRLPEKINKNELLADYKSIISKAKAQNAKISYKSHLKRTILEKWQEYESMYDTATELFGQMKLISESIRSRGIHYGTVDDTELNHLTKICWEFESIVCHRNTTIYRINRIKNTLGILLEALDDPEHESYMISV